MFSGKEGVNIERSVLAVWLGKSEYGRHRSEEHIPVDDASSDKTSVLILADDVVGKREEKFVSSSTSLLVHSSQGESQKTRQSFMHPFVPGGPDPWASCRTGN